MPKLDFAPAPVSAPVFAPASAPVPAPGVEDPRRNPLAQLLPHNASPQSEAQKPKVEEAPAIPSAGASVGSLQGADAPVQTNADDKSAESAEELPTKLESEAVNGNAPNEPLRPDELLNLDASAFEEPPKADEP